MIKVILMDFNGVIINDEPLHLRAYQEILKGEGIDLTEADYYSSLGMDDKAFIHAAHQRAGREISDVNLQKIMDAKTAIWRKLVDAEIPLFEGVENFLRKMEKDFAIGIVSMARREEIEYILDKIDLRGCFSIIVAAEDVSNHKPNPECYMKGFTLLDRARTRTGRHNPIVHGECLVVEDSPQGIMAGKSAGLKTLGVTNTVSAERLREAGADSVTKSLADWMPDTIRRVFV
ncbi:MAG TPA: HAD family phosphatase [Pyrinomonadaceae bacterium]|nr:HAD family phosphatase [Pyrinomonadaceae bacterium]